MRSAGRKNQGADIFKEWAMERRSRRLILDAIIEKAQDMEDLIDHTGAATMNLTVEEVLTLMQEIKTLNLQVDLLTAFNHRLNAMMQKQAGKSFFMFDLTMQENKESWDLIRCLLNDDSTVIKDAYRIALQRWLDKNDKTY